ncbi:extracellular solute-binding protein [Pseudomaricurvus alkylphenolicus]|uniref:ABC transporter substrate-binding protein n=1 Tax=Pseudomaricurvus alkylphenolicus TaxID=1306991 RepID=UPI00141DF2FC|nr:extracellular solute-binding protein [Pseudomaricurvus alkylphenolicus]NIB38751.1 extracellular solute-binding protein [Pseudomaricurvus alkylphenolicus]
MTVINSNTSTYLKATIEKSACSLLFLSLCLFEAAVADSLSIFAGEDHLSPSVIQQFQNKFGIKIRLIPYSRMSSREERIEKLLNTDIDLILLDNTAVNDHAKHGWIGELNNTWLPNRKNIHRHWREQLSATHRYLVPYSGDAFGLIYRADLITTPLVSWSAVFSHTQALHGKILLSDQPVELLSSVMRYLHQDIQSATGPQMRAAEKLLMNIRPSVRHFTSDLRAVTEHLASGNVWVAQGFSAEAKTIQYSDPNVEFVIPTEGSFYYVDGFAISAQSQNVRQAHRFLNFLMRKTVLRQIREYLNSPVSFRSGRVELDSSTKRPPKTLPIQQSPLRLFTQPEITTVRRLMSTWHTLNTSEKP